MGMCMYKPVVQMYTFRRQKDEDNYYRIRFGIRDFHCDSPIGTCLRWNSNHYCLQDIS